MKISNSVKVVKLYNVVGLLILHKIGLNATDNKFTPKF